MARYIYEVMGSTQMFAALIKNPHDRAEALRPVVEKVGGKLEAYYFSVGQPKVYLVCEFPGSIDPATIAALWVSSFAAGGVTSCSCEQVLTAAEMVKAFKKAGETGYRLPS